MRLVLIALTAIQVASCAGDPKEMKRESELERIDCENKCHKRFYAYMKDLGCYRLPPAAFVPCSAESQRRRDECMELCREQVLEREDEIRRVMEKAK